MEKKKKRERKNHGVHLQSSNPTLRQFQLRKPKLELLCLMSAEGVCQNIRQAAITCCTTAKPGFIFSHEKGKT